ncbi:hypothetical protein H6P81_010902 [Aristolochia fimbriata]|uniref:Cytochrome P450 n=1 Tax=Aristolochia fimbriata TaxID=158543 RepID=A0AAV7EQ25_ARIFI|nr:hypothetical protein H6P81_010902 [Aristolochia fimbriata]
MDFSVGLMTLFLGSTFILLLIIFTTKRSQQKHPWPPGPPKLPIIGNLHQLQKGGPLLHITLAEMAKQYGKIMTVWLGNRPTIVVSDYESVWEVLVTKSSDYASRSMPYRSKFITAGWRTLSTFDFSDTWFNLRKGAQSSFFHPANVSGQSPLQESDVEQLIRSIEEEAKRNIHGVVSPLPHIRKSVIRLIARLCFGPDFRDEKFVEAMDVMIEEAILQSSLNVVGDIFPMLQHVPGFKKPFRKVNKVKCRIRELIRPCIDRYASSSSSKKKNYYYLQFLLSQGFPLEVVIFNIYEMFLLAVDSTSMTIAWALGFLIHDQQIQDKLYKELISREYGKEGALGMEQVSKMKYLQGVVKESARLRPIAPLAIPHKAVKDTTLKGERVEAGTTVMVNLYAVLHDPAIWKEPNRFHPERFLENNSNGGEGEGVWKEEIATTAMEKSFLPFGAGRRICAGMELAKPHMALTLGNLVKAFQWSTAIEGELPDLSEDSTFVLGMKTPLLARVVPRHA